MKKLLALALLVCSGAAFAQVSGFPRDPRFRNVTVTGTLASAKACNANYVRVAPNYCASTQTNSFVAVGTACTTTAAPTGAKGVVLSLDVILASTNALNANHFVQLDSFSTAACGVIATSMLWHVKEWVATPVSQIAEFGASVVVPVVAGNYLLKRTDTIGVHTVNTLIEGYFD